MIVAALLVGIVLGWALRSWYWNRVVAESIREHRERWHSPQARYGRREQLDDLDKMLESHYSKDQ